MSLKFFRLAPLVLAWYTAGPALADDQAGIASRLGWKRDASATERQQRPLCHGAWVIPTPNLPRPAPGEVAGWANRAAAVEEGESSLSGHVTILSADGRSIEAENAELNQGTGKGFFSGDILLTEPDAALAGERAFIDLNSKAARIENTHYVTVSTNAHGHAARIERNSAGVTRVFDGEYSTCEPGTRDWHLSADHILLDPTTGRGDLWHGVLHLGEVPVLYLPYLNFPIDDRRKTGVLVPRFGNTNDGGFDLSVPVYLNLAPNYDATLTPRLLSRRGTMAEGDFRYLLPHEWGTGTFTGAYLPQDQLLKEDRKSAGLRHDGKLSQHWSTRVNLNYVSDPYYFNDLGTDFNISNATHQERMGEVSWYHDGWQFLARTQGYQTVDPLIQDKDKPYARLPQLSLSGVERLPHHLELELPAELVSFYREIDDGTAPEVNGQRLRLSPALRYRLERPWGYFRPTARLNHLRYQLTENPNGDTRPNATVPSLALDTGLVFERPMGSHLVQTLEPRLYALRADFQDQRDLPNFDTTAYTFNWYQLFRESRFAGGDRLDDANQLTLALTTRVLDSESGLERLRLSGGQILYFDDRRVTLDPTAPTITQDRSGIVLEGASQFNKALSLTADGLWSNDGHMEQSGFLLHYRPDGQRLFNVGLRFRRENVALSQKPLRQSHVSTLWPLSEHWQLVGLMQYDHESRQPQDQLVGLQYDSCCWRVRLSYRAYLNDPDNLNPNAERRRTAPFLEFQLKGLASFGDDLKSLLKNNVYGYSELDRSGETK